MAEQLPQPDTGGMAKLSPEKGRPPEPVALSEEEDQELVSLLKQAREAENKGQTALAVELLQEYRQRYEALRKQRIAEKKAEQGELGPETLQKNQKSLDLIFGKGRFNLQKEYEAGNIRGLSQEQLEAIEALPKEERYSEILIIPGQISREEVFQAIDQKYQERFGQSIWYEGPAKADLNQTQAAKKNPRPQGFYVIAVQRTRETIDCRPKTADQDLTTQLNTLKLARKEHRQLNLRGMTLPEAFLLDAFILANEGEHADSAKGFNRCLEELILDEKGNPARALRSNWLAVLSQLKVLSDSEALSIIGARLAAVSSS